MRNFLVMMGIVILSLVVFSAAYTSLSYSFLLSDKKETLRATASIVAISASAKSAEADLTDMDLRMTIISVAKASDSHISICDQSGRIVTCSDDVLYCTHINQIIPAAVLNEIDALGNFDSISDLNGYYSSARHTSGVAIMSPYSDSAIGYVFVAVESKAVLNIWRAFSSIFFIIAFVVMFIALIASLLLTARQVAPLREMAEVSRRLAKGDFSARVTARRNDEMGELIESYNLMVDAIRTSEMSRREFVANISHELKTPMTTISGFADGLLDGTIQPEQQKRYLQTIADETRRLSRLVRRMLEISRYQAVDNKVLSTAYFDITEAARRTLLSLEAQITDKALDMDILIPEDALFVRGEEDAIRQVLFNILENAVKFADSASVLKLRIYKKADKAYVSVCNSGTEIPEEDMPFIFDRFHKSDRSRAMDKDGVGLGLYIVKSILSAYGEDIYVKSSAAQTEFVFTLTLKEFNKTKVLSASKKAADSKP